MNAGRRSNAWCKLIQAPVMISHCYNSDSFRMRASERTDERTKGSRIARYKLGGSQSGCPAPQPQPQPAPPSRTTTLSLRARSQFNGRPAHYPDTQMICGARAIRSAARFQAERPARGRRRPGREFIGTGRLSICRPVGQSASGRICQSARVCQRPPVD